jgi:methylmalonyl-CoA mutase cobalamin-binding domain/chain
VRVPQQAWFTTLTTLNIIVATFREESGMRSDEGLRKLKDSLLGLDMEAAIEAAKSIAGGGGQAAVQDAITAVSDALGMVGKRFQDGEWFLTELVYAGEIAKEVMGLLSPLMEAEASQAAGTVVVGTVAGDLHDLGKNIFTSYARGAGFKVIDLGVDVPADRFVGAATENGALALGMSCLITSTEGEIGKVIAELEKQGLRDKVKVIIGGAALTEQFGKEVGADAFAPDAITGIDIIKKWSGS